MASHLTDEQLKKKLTPQQYKILRQKGTEAPFTGEFLDNKADGTYACAACETRLFKSEHKFDSGSGWPSFYDVFSSDAVKLSEDRSQGMQRVEATCGNCGSHLGHVFNDAQDQPTGQRYCINSACLGFMPNSDKDKSGK